ncbi:MAG TPA: FAD-dependent oxidoreductase, partial [Streptosporangiaceae bacterium]|nr:FAD-dependent oxidoreductase [Streptosporangiaceae bacterium]
MAERVDVVVLGMGVGGEELANTLADNGLNVVGIESNLVGGECPYFGCIP